MKLSDAVGGASLRHVCSQFLRAPLANAPDTPIVFHTYWKLDPNQTTSLFQEDFQGVHRTAQYLQCSFTFAGDCDRLAL